VLAACDLDRIGVLGMSFGAAAATSTAQADTRVKAAVCLDGGQCLSDLLDTDIRVPLLELSSDIVGRMTGLGIDAHLIEYNEFFFETLRTAGTREDVTRVLIPDVLHVELTDFLLVPASERAEALPGGGKADGPRVIALLNGFIGGYFDSVLKGEHNGYPKAQLDEFPETRTIDLTAIRTWAGG
jgi:pimeloyl-ACP methyl ester carboxylesterase